MNKKLITEAMAKADGYEETIQRCGILDSGYELTHASALDYRIEVFGVKIGSNIAEPLPDYFTDNEIDRMVREMHFKYGPVYWNELQIICERDSTDIWLATAAQKVEAYLKARGLWTEEME